MISQAVQRVLKTDRHNTDFGFLSIAWLLFGVKHFGRLLADPRKLQAPGVGRILRPPPSPSLSHQQLSINLAMISASAQHIPLNSA